MAQCIGSGVPGDWWEHGHILLPGTDQQMFPTSRRGRGRSSYFYLSKHRCYYCDSTRRYWLRSTDATAKAAKSHRTHAHKMVKLGLAPDVDAAVRMMNNSGVTVAWMAATALARIGKQCPGRCFHGKIVDGHPAITGHVISEWGDLQFDWKDPRYPLSPENSGWLCPTCNRQKQRMPWAEFMARQHAIRENYLHGKLMPIQATLF